MASVAAKHSLNFSFSGCGFLGMYHLGAVARLKDGQIGNQDSFEINSALGASAGALGKLISRNSTDIYLIPQKILSFSCYSIDIRPSM